MDGAPAPSGALIVEVGGFEGPLDLLLALARQQKVDLREISVLALARQYLAFVERAALAQIDLAADYLVMAAWLAYLKSRLLLPDPAEEAPEAEEMARDLTFRLARLEAMRRAAASLMERPRLGRDVFGRGMPEPTEDRAVIRWTAGLHDLLSAYAAVRTRDDFRPLALERRDVLTMEEAMERLRPLLGEAVRWSLLAEWVPPGWDGPRRRSATAATFAAVLELVREGVAELRQAGPFAPLQVRARPPQ
ncbi:ScpA family protein [Rubellimicrobium sp. CFH 75288]|uniref:segregation and condensation protein A n=1 Tax=Rubellimicrobium sp. CFH 75288 TaxID=2697034 RepID=UPI001411FBC9|nr:ScpA family protein [Rubellimicrobium sp. CFH 75288]NAZ35394.1 segregation/condensation protein A [Rubellimicrobium sp. CFH 75288]